ncbi:Protein of unknown function [Geopseudomonas sagittaria]|uniref:DUF3301 domain-containing protein n=1 Tax=Geopseudomonas sagittaria TaxID=1135990 RepID=A0A1I5Z8H4_9GAMM|nr:DUF3301 domain-containing protein [Pseudomonas sagittaria]MCM2330492.1 DUF3301 domain-containing protein [Pseudomonas sagittaria]SFQ52744.1 Protein of unknown function [Pseudomonas sagittaria]
MLTLGELTVLLLAGSLCAWFWHGHGVHEHALKLVRQACLREDVLLLDDNVAFRRLRLLRDRSGRLRLAREYGFEFTVTGEQRHPGRLVLVGRSPAQIELAPHPFREPLDSAEGEAERVVKLDEWRRRHPPQGR